MHDFYKIKVAHARHQELRRAEVATTATTAMTATTATTATAASTTAASTTAASATTKTDSTTSASTSATTKATSSATSTSSSTTSSIANPLLQLTSLGQLTSSTSSSATSTTSQASSTSSTPTTTSSSTAVSNTTSAVSTVTASSLTSSASVASATSSSSSSSSGLTPAATGGIVAACVFAGLALLIFAVRKTFIQRRKRKRNTWGAGAYPEISDKFTDASVLDAPPPVVPEKVSSPGYLTAQPRTPVWAPPRPVSPNPPAPMSTYYVTPPPVSYNNPIMDAAPATLGPAAAGMASSRPASGASMGWGASRPSSAAVETAVVRVVYIPTLPDELSITTGEIVQVVNAYDDGWALCANARGEQGVVPVECLDRSAAQAAPLSVGYGQQESGSDWRNMKRMSSLSTQQPHY